MNGLVLRVFSGVLMLSLVACLNGSPVSPPAPQPPSPPTPTPPSPPAPQPPSPPPGPFAPNPKLEAIPENTALDLGGYTCAQPTDNADYCEAITDYSGFVYDSARHQLLMFGGGHASTFRDDVDVFSFDTLKWQSAYPSTKCADMTVGNIDSDVGRWKTSNHPFSRHTYDLLAFAENTKELLMLSGMTGGSSFCAPSGDPFYYGGTVAAYDPVGKLWSYSSVRPKWDLGAAEYDPIAQKVILLSQYGLWSYDPISRTSSQHLTQSQVPDSRLGYGNNLVYFPPNQKMYDIARESPTRVFEVSLDRADLGKSNVVEMSGMTGVPDSQESGWAFDSVHQVIGGGIKNGQFYSFNPITKTWKAQVMKVQSSSSTTVGTMAFHALAFDPVNRVFVFISDYASGRHVWAYRPGG